MGVTNRIHRGSEELVQYFRRKAFEEERPNGRPKLGD
jgi:hypothetical protein